MPHQPKAYCRTCGKPIVWCVTENDKRMPLDAEPERRFVLDPCEVCAGSGKLLTDEPCGICKGTGSGAEEKVGLRLECHRLSQPVHVLAEAADEWRRRCPCACRECEALATAYAKLSGGRDAG